MNTSESTHETVNRLAEVAMDTANKAAAAAQPVMDGLRQKAGTAVTQGRNILREKPLAMILGTLAVGFAAGYVMAHREHATLRRRQLEEPLNAARDALQALLAPLASKVQETYSAARGATGHALDSLQHGTQDAARGLDSLVSHARKAGHNLKFW